MCRKKYQFDLNIFDLDQSARNHQVARGDVVHRLGRVSAGVEGIRRGGGREGQVFYRRSLPSGNTAGIHCDGDSGIDQVRDPLRSSLARRSQRLAGCFR